MVSKEIHLSTLSFQERILVTAVHQTYIRGYLMKFERETLQQIHETIEDNRCAHGLISNNEQYATITFKGMNFRAKILNDLGHGLRNIELIDVGITMSCTMTELRPMSDMLLLFPQMAVKIFIRAESRGDLKVGQIRTINSIKLEGNEIVGCKIGHDSDLILTRKEMSDLRFTRLLPKIPFLGPQSFKVISHNDYNIGVLPEKHIKHLDAFERELQLIAAARRIYKVSVHDFVLVIWKGRKFRAIVRSRECDIYLVENVDRAVYEKVGEDCLYEIPEHFRKEPPFSLNIQLKTSEKLEEGSIYGLKIIQQSDLCGRLYLACTLEMRIQRDESPTVIVPPMQVPDTVEVIVYSINDRPDHKLKVYGLQIPDSTDLTELDKAISSIKKLKPRKSVKKGDFVLTIDNGFCSRCVVVEVFSKHISAMNIDYGSPCKVPLESVFELTEELCKIRQCSFQCIVDEDLVLYNAYDLQILSSYGFIDGLKVLIGQTKGDSRKTHPTSPEDAIVNEATNPVSTKSDGVSSFREKSSVHKPSQYVDGVWESGIDREGDDTGSRSGVKGRSAEKFSLTFRGGF